MCIGRKYNAQVVTLLWSQSNGLLIIFVVLIPAPTMRPHIAMVILALTACQVLAVPSRGAKFFNSWFSDHKHTEDEEPHPHLHWIPRVNIYSPGPLFNGRTSYRKISRSLAFARFRFKTLQSLWHLTGNSAALLPSYLSDFKSIVALNLAASILHKFWKK